MQAHAEIALAVRSDYSSSALPLLVLRVLRAYYVDIAFPPDTLFKYALAMDVISSYAINLGEIAKTNSFTVSTTAY